jgi:DNA-binding winged helix-turn-helix (wHTH) protein
MPTLPRLRFGAYWLDPANEQVGHGTQLVRLTPKAFAVLRYLVERPGQLVTKDELLA